MRGDRTRDGLIRVKRTITPDAPVDRTMVHTISLGAALLIILVAFVFLFLIGPLGLLILVLAAILFWYAFGPGARRVVVSG
jgi:Flp pilus assembly protein TadB